MAVPLGLAHAEPITEEASYIYSVDISPREGCKLAEQALKRQAVARQCGSLMSGGVLRFKSETTDDLFRLHFETTGGRVTGFDSAILNAAEQVAEAKGMLLRCTVQARVSVQCDQGSRDPAFLPAPESLVKLNETAFREGEAMQIRITLPADLRGIAHVNIVQLLPYWRDEKRVWRLYPNVYQSDRAYAGGETLTLPNAAYSLDPTVPKGRQSVEESLMVIFSRRPIALLDAMTIEQFHRVLGEIPLNERREVVLGYRIEGPARR